MKNARDAGKDFGITERAIWERIGEIDGAGQLAKRMPEHPDDSPAWGVKSCVEGWARFASSWDKKEPDKAADWAVSRGSQNCLSAVIASCPEKNFSKLASWLETQRGTSVYNEAAVAFANRIQSTDPESAGQWRKAGSNK